MLQRLTTSIASWYTPKIQDIVSIVGAIAFSYFMYRFAPIYFFGLIVPLVGAFVFVGMLTTAFLMCLGVKGFWDAIEMIRSPLTDRATNQLTERLKNNTLTLEDLKWFLQPGILRGKAKLNNAYLLINACEHERKDLLEILLPLVTKKSLFVSTNLQGLNACHIAVAKKNIEIIKLLYQRYKELFPTRDLLKYTYSKIEVEGQKSTITPLEYAAHLQLEQVYCACLELATPLKIEEQWLAMDRALNQKDIKRLELYDKVWGPEILDWEKDALVDEIFNEVRTENYTTLIDNWINRACQKGWLSSADEYRKALNQYQGSGTKERFSITQLFDIHKTTNKNNNGSSHNNENAQKFSSSTSAALH